MRGAGVNASAQVWVLVGAVVVLAIGVLILVALALRGLPRQVTGLRSDVGAELGSVRGEVAQLRSELAAALLDQHKALTSELDQRDAVTQRSLRELRENLSARLAQTEVMMTDPVLLAQRLTASEELLDRLRHQAQGQSVQ
jgi:Sec-independent protein translocase protein TatA